jgi:hypothetical protein
MRRTDTPAAFTREYRPGKQCALMSEMRRNDLEHAEFKLLVRLELPGRASVAQSCPIPPTPLFWATQNFYVDNNEMSTDEFSPDFENGKRHFAMNAKFCARMRAAIAQGLERTPIGVVTTPGTKHPECATNQITSYDLSRDGR